MTAAMTLLAALSVSAADSEPLGPLRQGSASYYAADGTGKCSFAASPEDLHVAALATKDWAGAAWCGACAEVQGGSGKVTVRIVDACPGCAAGHLDLSKQAFTQLASPAAGRIPIAWRFVPCPARGAMAYRFKEGSSRWWMGIQVRNHRLPLKALEVKVNDAFVALERRDYNYFTGKKLGPGPFELRLTSTTGAVVIEPGVTLGDGTSFVGTQQFP